MSDHSFQPGSSTSSAPPPEKFGAIDSVPAVKAGSRLSRITPHIIMNPELINLDDAALLKEMAESWENDWSIL